MSRSARFARYGGPEVLTVDMVAVPEPGPGQVRARVRTCAVNPFDTKYRAGQMASMFSENFPKTVGLELAGVVEATGPDVPPDLVGSEVIAPAPGMDACADYVLLAQNALTPKPAHLDWRVAGGLVVVTNAAADALRMLNVSGDDVLLVHAAAGGVGTIAVQLARRAGARVIGTASPPNHDRLRALGVEPLAYGPDLAERVRQVAGAAGVTRVLDAAGHGAVRASLELVADPRDVVTIADFDAAQQWGVRTRSGGHDPQVVAEVAEAVAGGTMELGVQSTYPLEEIAEAHREVERGHAHGKVVLEVS